MAYTVVFTPEAEEDLASLFRHIASAASPEIAARYTGAIVGYCEGLRDFPHRGVCRDDVRPGLRVTNYKRRAVIAFAVDDATQRVAILGIYYGGRDFVDDLSADLDGAS